MNKFEELIAIQVSKRREDLAIEKGVHTIGEFINAVFTVKNEKDAIDFYNGYVEYISNSKDDDNPRKLTPAQCAQSNIGWCFGEGMDSKYVQMWSRVCNASHPVFGQIIPSSEEAYKIGISIGKNLI